MPVYKVTPALPVAGGKAVVQYNRRGGSFHAFPIPEGESVKLLYGFNGWQESGKAAMTRVPVPAKPAAGAEVRGLEGGEEGGGGGRGREGEGERGEGHVRTGRAGGGYVGAEGGRKQKRRG